MRPVIKGLLVGCVALIVLAGIVVIVGVRLVRKNAGRLTDEMAQMRTQGEQFGRSASESACVTEAMSRFRNNTSFFREPHTRMWLSSCLESSQRDSAFCAEVPPADEIMRSVRWRMDECSRLGFGGDNRCQRILAEVQTHCGKSR